MYLQNIMTNYLNEDIKKFEIENSFKPLVVKKSEWRHEDKKLLISYKFDKKKFLEAFVIQIIKYNRETNAIIETRFKEDSVGIIIHALSSDISEIELEAAKDIDKIKKDVMYYYAD